MFNWLEDAMDRPGGCDVIHLNYALAFPAIIYAASLILYLPCIFSSQNLFYSAGVFAFGGLKLYSFRSLLKKIRAETDGRYFDFFFPDSIASLAALGYGVFIFIISGSCAPN